MSALTSLKYQPVKATCRVATDGTNIDLTSSSDPGNIDGVSLNNGDRVFLKDQNTASENGIYVAKTATDPTTWERAIDADTDAKVSAGMKVPVSEGSQNGDSTFKLETNGPITVGTSSLSFSVDGGGGGGFDKTSHTTQTGDADTTLVDIPLDDNKTSILEINYGVWADAGSRKYSAAAKKELAVTKSGGTITNTNTLTSDAFQQNVGDLFSSGDFKVSDNAGQKSVDVASPSEVKTSSPTVSSTKDLSSVTGISNTDKDKSGCDTDDSGNLHYCFDDGTSLKYLSPGGTIEEISTTRPAEDGHGVELAVDGNGDIHVVWVGVTNENVLYATKPSGGTWSADTTVDSTSNFRELSIGLDENNIPHISYSDEINDDLRYANKVGGSWSAEGISDAVNVSRTRIYVEKEDNVGIAYSESTNRNLKIAVGQSGSFSVSDVDTSGRSTAFDIVWSGSEWVIGYIDFDNEDLKESRGTIAEGWNTTKISNYAEVGPTESVLIRASDSFTLILVQGDSSGANPYEAKLYKNTGSGWSFDSILHNLNFRWSSRSSDDYWTITDNGLGDSTLASIPFKETLSETLNWQIGYQIKN